VVPPSKVKEGEKEAGALVEVEVTHLLEYEEKEEEVEISTQYPLGQPESVEGRGLQLSAESHVQDKLAI
jgi:hypothetical protein